MAEVVNMNRFRKQKARAEARREGDANAAKFGRSKAERLTEDAAAARARAHLDAHRRQRDDD